MILGRDCGARRIDAPIFRMHDLQSLGAAARLAEAADARAARQALLLLRGEIKEAQRQKPRAVGDPAQHLAPSAEDHLGQQHLALDRRALSGAQLAQRHDARAILVAQRQQKQQILGGLDSQGPQARARAIRRRRATP